MRRSIARVLAWSLVLALAGAVRAEESGSSRDVAPKWVLDVAEAVLAHHIDPPARQQMVLLGIKAVHEAAGVPAPDGLGRRVSAMATTEQLQALIDETWPRSAAVKDVKEGAPPDGLERAFVEGMLQAVPGGARLSTAKEAKVEQQFEGNVYVGIQIALSFDEKEDRPRIAEVFAGGPADRAGVVPKDLIVAIDGEDTRGMRITRAVERLRGEEGTSVEIQVRQSDSTDVRTYVLTRGRLMRPTISGLHPRPSGGWDTRLAESDPIGYLGFDSIAGSTPHELRRLARQLESEGIRALVLDLRGSRATFHPTVLVADALLEGGTIGQVRTAAGVTVYRADPDALFRSWPLAVLIDGSTQGPAEWLAAALQDNHRAVLVGAPTPGAGAVPSFVPVRGDAWAIRMATRTLQRADGRPIGNPSGLNPPVAERRLTRTVSAVRANPEATAREPQKTVIPDHVTAAPARSPGPASAAAPIRAPGAPRDPARDPALLKAVELLREALKASRTH